MDESPLPSSLGRRRERTSLTRAPSHSRDSTPPDDRRVELGLHDRGDPAPDPHGHVRPTSLSRERPRGERAVTDSPRGLLVRAQVEPRAQAGAPRPGQAVGHALHGASRRRPLPLEHEAVSNSLPDPGWTSTSRRWRTPLRASAAPLRRTAGRCQPSSRRSRRRAERSVSLEEEEGGGGPACSFPAFSVYRLYPPFRALCV